MDGESGGPAPLILVVEDHDDLRHVMSEMMQAEGYRVATAANGEEALSAIREHRPALVLLDIHMPGMDGFEVLESLRGWSGWKPRVMMMTALHEDRHRLRAVGLGACDFFVKGSYDLDTLLACIARHVAA